MTEDQLTELRNIFAEWDDDVLMDRVTIKYANTRTNSIVIMIEDIDDQDFDALLLDHSKEQLDHGGEYDCFDCECPDCQKPQIKDFVGNLNEPLGLSGVPPTENHALIPREENKDADELKPIRCPTCSQPYYCACGNELRYREPAEQKDYDGLCKKCGRYHVNRCETAIETPAIKTLTCINAMVDDEHLGNWVVEVTCRINEIINYLKEK